MATNIGMMDAAYFVGRGEILAWINSTLKLNLSKVEEVCGVSVSFPFFGPSLNPYRRWFSFLLFKVGEGALYPSSEMWWLGSAVRSVVVIVLCYTFFVSFRRRRGLCSAS